MKSALALVAPDVQHFGALEKLFCVFKVFFKALHSGFFPPVALFEIETVVSGVKLRLALLQDYAAVRRFVEKIAVVAHR